MTTTEQNTTSMDAEFEEFLNSLLGEAGSSTDSDSDWLDSLLADCAESLSDTLGDDHEVFAERDRSGAGNHKLHVHNKSTGQRVASLGVNI